VDFGPKEVMLLQCAKVSASVTGVPAGLSKWVRSKMRFFDVFRSAQASLAQFTKERLEAASGTGNTRWVHN